MISQARELEQQPSEPDHETIVSLNNYFINC